MLYDINTKQTQYGGGGQGEDERVRKKKQIVCVYVFLCVILYVLFLLASRPKEVDLDLFFCGWTSVTHKNMLLLILLDTYLFM